jgi:hypothetical protein
VGDHRKSEWRSRRRHRRRRRRRRRKKKTSLTKKRLEKNRPRIPYAEAGSDRLPSEEVVRSEPSVVNRVFHVVCA